MKLSEHGKDMLAAFGFAHQCDEAFDLLDDYEFSPEYFTGAVALTLEEAKILLTMVDDFPELSVANRLIKRLQERIDQAEKVK